MKIDIPGLTSVSEATIDFRDIGTWQCNTHTELAEDGAEILHIRLSAPEAVPPPKFDVKIASGRPGTRFVWTSALDVPNLPPDWGGSMSSQISSQTPLMVLVDSTQHSSLAIACSEATRRLNWTYGIYEEDPSVHVKIGFFHEPEAPISSYEASIRLDTRNADWADAVRTASDWICARPEYAPMPVPPEAFEPLYSTWYGFHQNIFDKELEREFAEASALGMRTLIVDDGWQTDSIERGYWYCGDWTPSTRRFPDMAAHVARVHALGMKYILWYSVPFVGYKSEAGKRFQGKFLYARDNIGAWILDPRFPEVREYLALTYEKAMREWNIDGFKLDFIDSFYAPNPDPAEAQNWAGRDIKTVSEAVLVLMQEVRRRLTAIKPEALIEFRQGYMGPAIRSFGNMIRAGDVPADPLRNRARIARLRLTSGRTAVHSDMLEWIQKETPEQAAQHILSVLFSVIQYSERLCDTSAENKRMIKHWIDWTREHREALLLGQFHPRHPELGFPLIEGSSETERIVAVYTPEIVATIPADRKETWIVNVTDSDNLALDLAQTPASAEVFNVFGEKVAIPAPPQAGLVRTAIPPSGLLHLLW